MHHFVRVDFKRFKAFDSMTIHLRHFNILVGPNNSGKSTILAAFRILAAAMRKAATRKPEYLRVFSNTVPGYSVELRAISVAEENIFFNYDDSTPATINFQISNGNTLQLYFPEQGTCYLIPFTIRRPILSPSDFKREFNCSVAFVPILGPVEHTETLYQEAAARSALFNYRAARNFRNIWYHYPGRFDEFRSALARTWPGMDVERPTIEMGDEKPRLVMFCPEDRIPREIFWSGFGFQVWCQMLTHLIQSRDASLFLIDEPDIYLHSDLQRQLIGILRSLGPDILIATHSTEIISEAESGEIVLINKKRRSAKRLTHVSEVSEVFGSLGSTLNPTLTQVARTRRVVFVEGNDFRVLARFARKLGADKVSGRADFAVVPVDGFNPERIRSLKAGMEATLGGSITAAAVLDRDYRCDAECASLVEGCKAFCSFVAIHDRKEIENFLLVPAAIDRAAAARLADRAKRSGSSKPYASRAEIVLQDFAQTKRGYVLSQRLAERRRYERSISSSIHDATMNEETVAEFEKSWEMAAGRFAVIPGKEALSAVNAHLQREYGVSLSLTAIVDSMRSDEIPAEMTSLVDSLSKFAVVRVD